MWYLREEFVVRRRWLDESTYADLVGLCQFLPGPASSQVGFSIGLMRAGYRGALAAWAAFTLPSAIALVLFGYGATALTGSVGVTLLHGLMLVAVAIVAQAVWGMARALCPDRERASIECQRVLRGCYFSKTGLRGSDAIGASSRRSFRMPASINRAGANLRSNRRRFASPPAV